MAEKRVRKFFGVLYPGSTSYDCDSVLDLFDDRFLDWAYILHDKDVDANGELKKPHIHWYGHVRNPAFLSTVANSLGVPENSIVYCKNKKKTIQYLIHLNDNDKYLYPASDVVSNFDCADILNEVDSTAKANKILDYVEHNSTNPYSLVKWALANGVWDEYRRSASIWSNVINYLYNMEDEKNGPCKRC